MSFNLTSSYAIISKAGAHASSTAVASSALIALFCDQAEADVCFRTRYDWVTNLASVKSNFQSMLSDIVSDLAAMKLICYDMSNYISRSEAQTILDVLNDNSNKILKELLEEDFKEVIK